MEDNFHTDWGSGGWFGDDSSTFFVYFVSIVITSASSQINRH